MFVAQDMHSRMVCLMAASQAATASGARFLRKMLADFSFAVESVQAGGGGEFRGVFEKECQAQGVRLVILPPRSPKFQAIIANRNLSAIHNPRGKVLKLWVEGGGFVPPTFPPAGNFPIFRLV